MKVTVCVYFRGTSFTSKVCYFSVVQPLVAELVLASDLVVAELMVLSSAIYSINRVSIVSF